MTPDQLDVSRQAALRVAGRLVGAAEAEDIAQEVALRAVSSSTDIASYIGPWSVRVATNLCLDHLRRRDRFAEPRESLAPLVDSDMRVDLRRALDALPERQRQVMALRHLSDLDERSTAALLGISPGSVKRHLHRAVAALRTSPHLIHHVPTAREETPMTYDWSTQFTRAVEPEGGWQRPWDHWRLESSSGRVARIAVIDGQPVLDAEGDEVMSGPGFNHEVVKVLPAVLDDEPTPVNREFERLPGLLGELLGEALEEAHLFGHLWVGDEHLALVLARRGIAWELARLEEGVARFYEGPFAEARLALVQARRSGEPFLRDPVPKTFTWPLEQLIHTGPDLTAELIADRLVSGEHSLVRLLLGQENPLEGDRAG